MATNLRRLGVYGDNLPVKRTRVVAASDFLVAGIIGQFERKYNKSFQINSINEFTEIFGDQITPTFYGPDAVQGFFRNLSGVSGKAFIASYVGNNAGTIDAVVASRSVSDVGADVTFVAKAAYQEEEEFGVSGNRTGIKIVSADRFTTQASGTVAATGVTSAQLDSVIGIKVGDIVKFVATGGTPGTMYHKITVVNESAKTISWVGNFSGSGASLAIGDVVSVPGFMIKTYRRSISGIETEVESDLGRIVCTMESAVSDFYAPNVHSSNRWIVIVDDGSVSTLANRLIVSDANPVYLTGGADGTQPVASSSWTNTLALLANDPIRIFINPEVTNADVNRTFEAWAKARTDNPIFLATIAEDRTKAQLKTIGASYQRSDEVDMVVVANWLKVEDPFATGVNAPPRIVPNCGHVAGAWVRSIGANGVHYIPAVKTNPLLGVVGIVGEQFLNDLDRTEIAESGVNLIQSVSGSGIVIRNFFTPSTDTAYQFANGVLMRNYIKVSAVDSLQLSENQPNSINLIKADRMAILMFLYNMWDVGSTGNVPSGETFGQTQTADGGITKPEEHFEVRADLVNNPQSSINAGQRNLDVYFTYPAPAGSIKIGVGIMLLS